MVEKKNIRHNENKDSLGKSHSTARKSEIIVLLLVYQIEDSKYVLALQLKIFLSVLCEFLGELLLDMVNIFQ